MKLVLFDVDGTLLLTGGKGVHCMELAGQAMFGDHFSTAMLNPAGSMDPDLYNQLIEHHNITDGHLHHDDFQQRYFQHLTEHLSEPGAAWAMPGVLDLLAQLRDMPQVDLGLVTGNYSSAVPIKLTAVGIDPGWFDYNGFGDEADDRAGMIRLARKRHADLRGVTLGDNDVIMVGDTPNDIHAAKQAGCLCVAVATGRFSVDDLRKAGGENVVAELTDVQPLLTFIS